MRTLTLLPRKVLLAVQSLFSTAGPQSAAAAKVKALHKPSITHRSADVHNQLTAKH